MGKNPRMFIDIRGFFFQQFIFFFVEKKNPRMSHELEWEFFSRKKKKTGKKYPRMSMEHTRVLAPTDIGHVYIYTVFRACETLLTS